MELAENEFLNADGIICCSICKEPKQSKYEDHIFPRHCKCRRDKIAAEEAARKKLLLEQRRVDSIPNPKLRSFTFGKDDLQDAETTKILKKYVAKFEEIKDKGLGLLLWGDVGTGKSFYAHCIANALIDKGYSVISTDLAAIVNTEYNLVDKKISSVLSNTVIVLDDVGTERQTTFADETIYKFINKATLLNKVLILTTNFMPNEFEKAAQDTADLTHARIYSRILEKCCPVKVNKIKRREALKNENRAFIKNLLMGEDS